MQIQMGKWITLRYKLTIREFGFTVDKILVRIILCVHTLRRDKLWALPKKKLE